MNSILVFARAPQPGQVKTRLAAHIGDIAAARLYAAMLKDTLAIAENAARGCEAEVVVCYTPFDAFAPGAFSLANFWSGEKQLQEGSDLGEKMRLAINSRLNQGAKRVLIIGSDMPALESGVLCDAFEKLATFDLVFGPARDGGFYLIGARAPLSPDIFKDVPWSHNSTLHAVLQRARFEELSVALLPQGTDIDEWRDVERVAAHLQNKALHFQAVLREINNSACKNAR